MALGPGGRFADRETGGGVSDSSSVMRALARRRTSPGSRFILHSHAHRGRLRLGIRAHVAYFGSLTLGVRQGGERLRLHAGGPHRSLKNLLQEHAIPPWQRDRLPLLWCDGRLAWAAGIGFDADLSAAPGEAGVLPRVAD